MFTRQNIACSPGTTFFCQPSTLQTVVFSFCWCYSYACYALISSILYVFCPHTQMDLVSPGRLTVIVYMLSTQHISVPHASKKKGKKKCNPPVLTTDSGRVMFLLEQWKKYLSCYNIFQDHDKYLKNKQTKIQ